MLEQTLPIASSARRAIPRWRLFTRAMIGRAYPRVVGMNREKSWLIFDTLMPLLTTAAYVLVYEAMKAPPAFKGYVLLGGVMMTFWLNVLWSMAMQLYWDKEGGNLQAYLLSPAPLMAVLLGMALGGMVATTVRAIGVILIGTFLFDVSFHVSSPLMLVLVFVVSMAGLYGLGILLASIFLVYGRSGWRISALVQEGVNFVSGLYFPVASMGMIVAGIASLIPLTLGLDAIRQLIYPEMTQMRFLSVEAEIGILAGLAAIFITLARMSLRRMEMKSRRDGKLTERGS